MALELLTECRMKVEWGYRLALEHLKPASSSALPEHVLRSTRRSISFGKLRCLPGWLEPLNKFEYASLNQDICSGTWKQSFYAKAIKESKSFWLLLARQAKIIMIQTHIASIVLLSPSNRLPIEGKSTNKAEFRFRTKVPNTEKCIRGVRPC